VENLSAFGSSHQTPDQRKHFWTPLRACPETPFSSLRGAKSTIENPGYGLGNNEIQHNLYAVRSFSRAKAPGTREQSRSYSDRFFPFIIWDEIQQMLPHPETRPHPRLGLQARRTKYYDEQQTMQLLKSSEPLQLAANCTFCSYSLSMC
jgi:hypothetical protein